MESVTDKLNVPTNALDLPTDLVRIKSWGATASPAPLLGCANGYNIWTTRSCERARVGDGAY